MYSHSNRLRQHEKGIRLLLVPIGSLIALVPATGFPIFMISIVFDCIGALVALFVLKPLRRRWLETIRGVSVLALVAEPTLCSP